MTNVREAAGLIPARAGNTPWSDSSHSRMSAHPRSRGEHALSSQKEDYPGGSSPPVLGTRHPILSQPSRARLIPARAGNTKQVPAAASGARAHPRSRGSTSSPARISASPPAHPRSRGEHPSPGSPEITIDGSSPLARGTRRRYRRHQFGGRLIPARAGSTISARRQVVFPAAHPHSCGEHKQNIVPHRLAPPLLHGTHRDRGANVRRPMPYALPLPIPESRDLRNSSTSVMRRTPSN